MVDRNLFNQSSTGIGLSLVKELVEMHKATITVDSKLGEGSCFKVDFLKGKEHYDESVEFLQDDATVGMGVIEQVTDILSEIPDSSEEENIEEESEESMDAKGTMLLVKIIRNSVCSCAASLLPSTESWKQWMVCKVGVKL